MTCIYLPYFQAHSTAEGEAAYDNTAAGLHIYESNLADAKERQPTPQYEMVNQTSQVDVS